MKIMAIGAHPDDVEILCAGTLFRCKERGDEIAVCILTDGSAGHTEIGAEKIKKIRKKEAKKASELLDAELFWLGIQDEMLFDDKKTRLKLIETIRRFRPELILTHSENDYHPDHRAGFQLAFSCGFIASLKNVKTKSPYLDFIPLIYMMDTLSGIGFEPEEYVNISDSLDKKLKMLLMHKSQLKFLKELNNVDMVEMVKVQARFRGYQAGVTYAEGFKVVRGWARTPSKRVLP